jgi:hypothetical protein
MRLISFLSKSGLDEETNIFRSISIKLIDKPKDYTSILSHIISEYNIDCNIINDKIKMLNKNLRDIYKGKYEFSLCSEDEGSDLSDIKINKKYIKKMKIFQLECNNELSRLKTEVERKSKDRLNEIISDPIFDANTAKSFAEKIKKEIDVPFITAEVSKLGGEKNTSIIIRISLDPKDEWANNIYQNSRFLMFHITQPNIIELFAKAYTVKEKFRKSRVKSDTDAISKINAYIKKIK